MSWTFWLLLIPTLCYAGAMAVYLYKKDMPMAVIYSGYAWANLGLLWIDLTRRAH